MDLKVSRVKVQVMVRIWRKCRWMERWWYCEMWERQLREEEREEE
jgi:hypothetical protein